MYWLLLLTERCNLECAYCESHGSRTTGTRDPVYTPEQLIDFLRRDPHLELQFYGGEPLLQLDLMERILGETEPRRVCLQTNGHFLDRLPGQLLDRFDTICLSVDGPARVTDSMRGAGVYAEAMRQAGMLKERGYGGSLDARMTTTPGVSIYDAVTHLLFDAEVPFDAVYWQLNALFSVDSWRLDRKMIRRWFSERYEPDLTRLMDELLTVLTEEQRLLPIIPFVGLLGTLVSGKLVKHVRCGAGAGAWTITPQGAIFPCPVLRELPQYSIGELTTLDPTAIEPMRGLRGPCRGCDVIGICGGRCIYASETMHWGQEGFELVCHSVKHLIEQARRAVPEVERQIAAGLLNPTDYADVGHDYEVIP